MKRFVEGVERSQSTLFPDCLADWVGEDNPVFFHLVQNNEVPQTFLRNDVRDCGQRYFSQRFESPFHGLGRKSNLFGRFD